MKPVLRYTSVRGCRVHSLHTGSGEPVVLLHGLSGSLRWWRYTVPALSARYEVHVPELAGFGRSRPALTQFSIADVAALVGGWLDAIGLRRTRLIGHSMGAQIAVHLASREADRVNRLVLVSVSGIPRPHKPTELVRFITELVPPRAWGAPRFLPSIAADALRCGPRTLLRATRGLLADDIRPLLPRIAAPTLVVWGERDPLTPPRNGRLVASAIPDARLVVLEKAAHNPMVDRPHAFNRTVLEFLGE